MIKLTSTGEASCVQGLRDIPVSQNQLATHYGENVGDAPPCIYCFFPLPQRLHYPPITNLDTRIYTSVIQEEDVLSPDTVDYTSGILLSYSQ